MTTSEPKAKSPQRIAAEAEYAKAYAAHWAAIPSDTVLDEAAAASIDEAARAAGRAAAEGHFVSLGYKPCRVTTCTRLASPAFALCPVHGAKA